MLRSPERSPTGVPSEQRDEICFHVPKTTLAPPHSASGVYRHPSFEKHRSKPNTPAASRPAKCVEDFQSIRRTPTVQWVALASTQAKTTDTSNRSKHRPHPRRSSALLDPVSDEGFAIRISHNRLIRIPRVSLRISRGDFLNHRSVRCPERVLD